MLYDVRFTIVVWKLNWRFSLSTSSYVNWYQIETGGANHFTFHTLRWWEELEAGCWRSRETFNLTLIEYHLLPFWAVRSLFWKRWMLSHFEAEKRTARCSRRRIYECPLRVLMRSEEPLQAEILPQRHTVSVGLIVDRHGKPEQCVKADDNYNYSYATSV